MKMQLEESRPNSVLALLVMAVFYGKYLAKNAVASRPCSSDIERTPTQSRL